MNNIITTVVYVIVFMTPLIIFPGVLVNIFQTPKDIIIILGASILVSLKQERSMNIPKHYVALAAFCGVSLLYTANPYYTRYATILYICCMIISIFTEHVETDDIQLPMVITAAGVMVSIITWLQFLDIWPILPGAEGIGPITSTIGNPNYLGVYLLFPFFTALSLSFTHSRKVLPYLASILILSAIILSRSRAVWLALAFTVPIFLWWNNVRPTKLGMAAICTSILLLIHIWSIIPADMMDKRVAFSKIFDITSLTYRMKGYIPPAIEIWKNSPIIGRGLWSYQKLVYDAQSHIHERDGKFFDNYPNPKPKRVHNDYIEFLVDGGILYLILWIYLIYFHIKMGITLSQDPIAKAYTCSLIAISISALFFFPLRVNSIILMFFVIGGALRKRCIRQ